MSWSDPAPRDRAVAALLGYLLVFAVVIGGTVLLATAGLGLLADAGGADRAAAERVIERFDGGVEALLDGAPHRQLRLESRGGALEPAGNYTVTVTASGGGVGLTGRDAVTVSGEAVRYDMDGGRLTYAGGLVAYDQPGGAPAVERSSPDLRVSGDRFVVVLAATSVTGAERVGGGGTVPVALDGGATRVVSRVATTPDGNATNATGTLRVRGPSVGAWRDLFADRSGLSPTDIDGDGDREYAVDTDGDGRPEVAGAGFETRRLYVRVVTVRVRLGESL